MTDTGKAPLMPDPAPIRGRWTIRVCQHGHRVEYRENYGGWLHMDAPNTGVCDEAGVVEVVPVPDEAAIERAVDALTADSGLPRFSPVRAAAERRFRLGLRAALEPPA
jgi:hypothetical protein